MNASKKIVLISGSNGLLGQKLSSVYLKAETERVQLFASSRGANRNPVLPDAHYIEMDICNPVQVAEVFEKIRPHCLIHTAALTHVDECEINKKLCDQLNVEAVATLLDIASRYNTHFIHLSTDFIFDGLHGPYTEDAEANPVSHYGWSKLKAENLVKQYTGKWTIIRTVLVYGIAADMSRSNIVLWAKKALQSGDKLSVVNDQYRTPTLAEDLAIGCLLSEKKEAQGIFNISGKDGMTILELVQRVADYFQLDKSNIVPVSSSTLNQAAKRPVKTGFILDKAMEVLGYNPRSFEEGIAILEAQMQNRHE